MDIKKYVTGQFLNIPGSVSYVCLKIQGYDSEPRDAGKKSKRRISRIIPHFFISDIRDLKPEALKESGIKAIISDKDNTLTETYSDEIMPALEPALVELRQAVNQKFYVVSNSAGTFFYEHEARAFEEHTGIRVIRHFFKKPWGYNAAIAETGVNPDEILVIGDRIYTDIVFGNNIGALTVLVQPFSDKGELQGISSLRSRELNELEVLCKEYGCIAPSHPRFDPRIVKKNKMQDYHNEW